jgi:hypothetical protein
MMKTFNYSWIFLALGLFGTACVCQAAQPDYLSITETEVEVENKNSANMLALEIETKANIPMDGKSGAFGYAALTDGGNNLLVLVTHLPIDDSSHEKPVSGFHTHVLDLKQPTAACKGANFEVDLENSGKNKAFDADYKYQIKGSEIKIENVPVAGFG